MLYDKETLFERINGESELYFPYGFDALASARYTRGSDSPIAIEVDVYRMGSLLDAFGIYANYRRRDDREIDAGAGGFVSPSQLLFYQDRYFVRLQATGTLSLDEENFVSCARAVSRNLPQTTGRPRELAAFKVPGIVPKSERFIGKSLLGYDFFQRGLIADAAFEGEQFKVFLLPEASAADARETFDRYLSYLKASGKEVRITEDKDGVALTAADPLYNTVQVMLTGRYVIGAAHITRVAVARRLLDQIRKQLP